MYNPFFDSPIVIIALPMLPELDSDEAVLDEMESLWGQSYDQLMGRYESTDSNITRAAVRQIVMSADWEIQHQYDDFVAHVEVISAIPYGKNMGKVGRWTWANCTESDLRSDAHTVKATGDDELAGFLFDLMAQIDETEHDYLAERSYYQREPRYCW